MANCSKLLLVLLFWPFLCLAQSNNTINSCIDQFHEEVYLHLSRNIVAVGETIYFKAYIFDKISDKKYKSNILYIQLLDNKNITKGSFKTNISENTSESSFVIPDSLATGQYSVIAYTNLMRNFPASALMRYTILVAGVSETQQDLNSSGVYHSIADSAITSFISKIPENSSIHVELNKYEFKPKETVILNIESGLDKDSKTDISISVSEVLPGKFNDINPDITIFHKAFYSKNFISSGYQYLDNTVIGYNKLNAVEWRHKAENNGFRLEGTVFNKSSQVPAAGKQILLSVPDSFANLKYCITDSSGYFRFILDENYNNRKIIVNVNNDNENNEYYFTFDNKLIPDDILSSPIYDISGLNDYFLKCRKIELINKIFNPPAIRLSLNKPMNLNNFYGSPTYTTKLSDFIELNDFTDISKNVLPGVRFKKKKDKYRILLRSLSQNQETYTENCLVLMNNIPFYDFNYLATLGSSQIDHIDVNTEHIAYGNIGFYGILSVYTRDKIIISNKGAAIIDNNFEGKCGIVANTVKPGTKDKMPLFKQLLYWNPEVTFDSSGKAQMVFNTSDLTSDYIIDIEGIVNGQPYSKKLLIKVR